MMYRAKVTNILEEILEHGEYKNYPRVKDAHDVWIEVPTEEQADQLEEYNERGFIESHYIEELLYMRKSLIKGHTSKHYYARSMYMLESRPKCSDRWMIHSFYLDLSDAREMKTHLESEFPALEYALSVHEIYRKY